MLIAYALISFVRLLIWLIDRRVHVAVRSHFCVGRPSLGRL